MRYIIGTSYFDGENSGSDWFFNELWKPAMRKLLGSMNPPERIVIIGVANSIVSGEENMDVISLSGDLGHCHQFIGKKEPAKNNELSSWEASVLALAMIAYTNETDFVFAEQDMLAFGPWIEQLYKELQETGKKMLFGKSRCMPCAQSLFIIKHEFLLTFISDYIYSGHNYRLGEDKFMSIMRTRPNQVGQFSFGFDRDRPVIIDNDIWYAQKLNVGILEALKEKNLIQYDKLPPNIERFTND